MITFFDGAVVSSLAGIRQVKAINASLKCLKQNGIIFVKGICYNMENNTDI